MNNKELMEAIEKSIVEVLKDISPKWQIKFKQNMGNYIVVIDFIYNNEHKRFSIAYSPTVDRDFILDYMQTKIKKYLYEVILNESKL